MNSASETEREADAEPVILLVEDNPADVRLTEEMLRMAGFPHRLQVARDGEQALQMMRREAGYANLPVPDLVLLDLNLPRIDGREVLRQIKQDTVLRRTPVLILTTSQAEGDIKACYDAHANCYLTKPVDIVDFGRLIELIRDFWLGVVRLPGVLR
ncbi:MAG: response regulator [Nevskiales bacterium]|nr:response regulator [Nevskiales bacterium]